ncbi:MAG: hypothetical protein V1725_01550 [archaeon]
MRAWFILLLLLPIASAEIDVRVYGSQNVSGYRAMTDTTTFFIRSSSPVNFVSADGQLLPIPCVDRAYFFECQQTFPSDTRPAGMKNFTINNTDGESHPGNFTVDGVSPTIVVDEESLTLRGRGVTFTYALEDHAAENEEGCSGLKQLIVLANNRVQDGMNFSEVCNSSGTYAFSYQGEEETIDIRLRVHDAVNNYAETELSSLHGDFSAPRISDQFTIWQGAEQLTRISLNPESISLVRIDLRIEDENLSTVVGDLSSLNPMHPEYADLTATCYRADEGYHCSFENIALQPETGTLTIVIVANDTSGNIVEGESSAQLEVVAAAGSVRFIGPGREHCDQQCFITNRTSFIVELEPGSDFSTGNVLVSTDNTNQPIRVRNCSLANVWTCTSPSMALDMQEGQSARVYVATGSTDDYGNPLTEGMLENVVVFDSTPPQNDSAITVNLDCPVFGEPLEINVLVREELSTQVFIAANTSRISTHAFIEEACIPGSRWNCTLHVQDLTTTSLNTTLDIVIRDLAGNKFIMQRNVSICENINARSNVISSIEATQIPVIDKQIATYRRFKAYVPLRVHFVDTSSSIVESEAIICSARDAEHDVNEEYLFDNPELLMSRSSTPVLSFYIGREGEVEFPDKINLTCELDFYTRQGSRRYREPETKTFSVLLGTTNVELGNFDTVTQKKYDDAVSKIHKLQQSIERRESIDRIAGTFCRIVEYIGMINGAMQTLRTTIYTFCMALYAIPLGVTQAAAEAIWAAANTVLGFFHGTITQYIYPPGSVLFSIIANPTGTGPYIKLFCFIYTCKFYEADEYIAIVSQVGGNMASGLGPSVTGHSLPGPSGTTRLDWRGRTVSPGRNGPIKLDIRVAGSNELPTVDEIMATTGLYDGNWIINPYKSKYNDALCIPAQIYNMKKEKQIACKYAHCLQDMKDSGQQPELCEYNYRMGNCLYVESAQVKLHGPASVSDFFKGMLTQIINALPSIIISIGYQIGCANYYVMGGHLADSELATSGWHGAACGVTGTILGLREVMQMFDSRYWQPSAYSSDNLGDACDGL